MQALIFLKVFFACNTTFIRHNLDDDIHTLGDVLSMMTCLILLVEHVI